MATVFSVPRRRWRQQDGRVFVADDQLPARTARLKVSIDPDADDKVNAGMKMVLTFYGAGDQVIHTATMQGGSLTNSEGLDAWPFVTVLRVREGQPLKVSLEIAGDQFFAPATLTALEDGES